MRRLQSHKSDKILVKNKNFLLNNETIQYNMNDQMKSKQTMNQLNPNQSEFLSYQKKIPLKQQISKKIRVNDDIKQSLND